ncbi:MAG: TetR/AcrR family transcriptional regulator, partial [Cyanobacteria bacterium P01_G01_bin.4]
MPRTLEFDRDVARLDAMALFWSQGYKATSLEQLLQTMGIGRSSFYATFADKQSLFIDCLDIFFEQTMTVLRRMMQQHPAPYGIHGFLEKTVVRIPISERRRGCMLVNTLLESADVDEVLHKAAAQYLSNIQAEFKLHIQTAQEEGCISRQLDAESLSAAAMLINQGLRVSSRSGVSSKELSNTLRSSMALLQLA